MTPTRIMVVEDESIIAEDIQAMLEGLGYVVPAIALSGEEAIRKARETRPDLVLLDIVLRDQMDGVAVADYLRTHCRIPVIYLTAYADEQTVHRARLTEPFGYILKPFNERELRAAIELALYKHQMDKQLKDSARWLATTLRCIGDAVLTTDAQGRITSMNPAAEALTGWTQREAEGRLVAEVLPVFQAAGHSPPEHPVVRVLREGVALDFANHDRYLRTKEGGQRPIDDSAAPIRDEQGQLMGAVVVCRDIADRQHLQAQLMHAQKMEAIGRLAGRVAHDFNNLLTVISLYSELLLQPRRSDEQLAQYARQIKKAVEHAAALTGQLQTVGRRQVRQPVVVDLNAVIAAMEEMLPRLLGESVELVVALDPELRPVAIDPEQLKQVVFNLVVNARDAMAQGGKLSIETANVELDERDARRHAAVAPGPYVMLAIGDTGCGMDRETQARLFEPFFTTKPRGKGAGLSLASVHAIVSQGGGHIDVDSAPGQGTTFRLYLPAAGREVAPPAAQRSAAPMQGAETILLVEDEQAVQAAVCESLRLRGYTVLRARHGREAMLLSERHPGPIHLLLTDVVMPQMTGPELIKHLAPQRPEMKILLMSGYPGEALAGAELETRTVAFLPKPFTPDTLARKVREVLDAPATPPSDHRQRR
jgi:two-component system cell cycle sensor histidine kinase/response regulator CckA